MTEIEPYLRRLAKRFADPGAPASLKDLTRTRESVFTAEGRVTTKVAEVRLDLEPPLCLTLADTIQ